MHPCCLQSRALQLVKAHGGSTNEFKKKKKRKTLSFRDILMGSEVTFICQKSRRRNTVRICCRIDATNPQRHCCLLTSKYSINIAIVLFLGNVLTGLGLH
ncbi:hypothetical protein CEXT_769431 [Caerostris extrusa]|uniref:Uncharacterized protein n=1 Tax=Caerostris extrusa TaxID=172846 RepID=A0AAV4XBY1_CAEEX|nr:hypothetical protein CEXT_769431 [Caerostris extrusa]